MVSWFAETSILWTGITKAPSLREGECLITSSFSSVREHPFHRSPEPVASSSGKFSICIIVLREYLIKAKSGSPRVIFSCKQQAVLNPQLSQNFYAQIFGFFSGIDLINLVGFYVFDSCRCRLIPINSMCKHPYRQLYSRHSSQI